MVGIIGHKAAAAWLALGVCLGAAPVAAEGVKISFTHSLANAPFLIAKERGYFAAEGLTPQIIYSNIGRADYGGRGLGNADFGATGLSGGFLNLAGQGAMQRHRRIYLRLPGLPRRRAHVLNRAWDAGFRTSRTCPPIRSR